MFHCYVLLLELRTLLKATSQKVTLPMWEFGGWNRHGIKFPTVAFLFGACACLLGGGDEHAHVCRSTCMEVRGQPRVLFIRCVHLFPLRRGLSLCLELTYQERLDRQETPETHLSLPPRTKISSIWYYIQHILKWVSELNLGPQVCTVDTLPTPVMGGSGWWATVAFTHLQSPFAFPNCNAMLIYPEAHTSSFLILRPPATSSLLLLYELGCYSTLT